MLHRQKGQIIFECNECGETLDTGTGDFDAAKAKLDAEEWKASKEPNMAEWDHTCPDCQ